MTPFRSWLLHRAWLPAVALIALVLFVPRVIEVRHERDRASQATGVYAWEEAPPGPSGEAKFRWTRSRAVVREPVRGTDMVVPIYLARPDIATVQVYVRITIAGLPAETVTLTRNGWHVLTFDVARKLGQSRWRSMRAVTVEFTISPAVVPAQLGSSSDMRELGIGIGAIRWTGAPPDAAADPRVNPS